MPLNPYVAGNPVGDSTAFIGRADVLREVARVLRRSQDNAIVLYGQRRIGKTSILQHLEAQLPNEGPYRPVYFDLQDKADWPLGRVLQNLAREVAHALSQPDPDLGDAPAITFRQKWLPAVLDDLPEGCSLVLLFDEFDVLADPKGEQAGAAFFPYLRNLLASDPGRLQFVFVIGRNVDDLDTIALSLFKGTPYRRVSLLNREDTADLVRLSETNGTLLWPDDTVERVWQLTNGHPFLTQQLCSHVWERAYDEDPDEPPTVALEDVNAAVPDALDASRNTLEWLWGGLPPAERVVISALAEAGPGPITQEELEQLLHESGVRVVIRELQNAPQLLQEWDLIEPADGGYRFRVELLRRWLTEHKPLRRVQEELDRIEPVAEDLYQAGSKLYRSGQMDQAIAPLRQAIELNPNHVRANQLLADILLAQGQASEARQLLERLHEYQPAAARPRLVQALLAQAQAAENGDELVILYNRMLELDSMPPEITAELQRTSQRRMQECIVCKRFFDSGAICLRCGTDNSPWLVQQAYAPDEQGGLLGYVSFVEPYFFFPLLITGLALVLGLLGAFTLWSSVQPLISVLGAIITPLGCLLSSWEVYENRMRIREAALLSTVRRGWRKLLGLRTQTLLAPVMAIALTLIVIWLLIASDLLWELTQWLVLEPINGQLLGSGRELPESLMEILPFVSLIGFTLMCPALTYSSSLMLVQRYIIHLSRVLPPPIFLQEDLLLKVVRREAEIVVCRLITPEGIGGKEQDPRGWTWDEMERTADGGIRLKAIVRAASRTEENLIGERTERPVDITYIVKADLWGRITRVDRLSPAAANSW